MSSQLTHKFDTVISAFASTSSTNIISDNMYEISRPSLPCDAEVEDYLPSPSDIPLSHQRLCKKIEHCVTKIHRS